MRYFIGVDPGYDGAVALINERGAILDIKPIPTYNVGGKRGYAVTAAWRQFRDMASSARSDGVLAVIVEEPPTSMGSERGAMGAMSLFRCDGIYRAFAVALNDVHPFETALHLVGPQQWQKVVGIKSNTDKAGHVARAQELWPGSDRFTPQRGVRTKVQCEGFADAALIAEWGRRTL